MMAKRGPIANCPACKKFLTDCYYKRRGRVEGAYFLNDEGMRPLLPSDLL